MYINVVFFNFLGLPAGLEKVFDCFWQMADFRRDLPHQVS